MKRMVWMLAVGVLVMGCSKREAREKAEAEIPEPAAAPVSEAADVFARIDGLLEDGATNAAIEALTGVLENEQYKEQRGWAFSSLLYLLMMTGQEESARAKYGQAIREDEELARAGFGVVGNAYASRGETNALQEWVAGLAEAPLPPDLALRAFAWHLGQMLDAGNLDGLMARVSVCLGRFDDKGVQRILSGVKAGLLAQGEFGRVDALLGMVETAAGDRPGLRDFATASRIELAVRQGAWDEAEKRLLAAAGELPDPVLSSVVAIFLGQAANPRQVERIDRVCDELLRTQREKTETTRRVVSEWVLNAVGSHAIGAVRRMKTAMESYVDARTVMRLYGRHFYGLVDQLDDKGRRELIAIGDLLDGKIEDPVARETLKAMQFDGAFLIGDYDRTLAMLEEGVAQRDEAWHEMASNKVKAHLALKNKNIDEAVRRFREFMEYIGRSWGEPQRDPSTGVMHSREMALGFNARRIGDILRDAGQEKAAADVYAEARGYYLEAKHKLAPDSKEYRAVEEALAALPGQEAKGAAADK